MHIPDGFLDHKTIAATAVLAAGAVGAALFRANRSFPTQKVPLMGLSAAFVFAAQMINFPVAGGTSGHLVGGVLTAVLLGPSAALIVITSVLIVQALLFGDGGITALGANIVNMGLIGGVLGFAIYDLLRRVAKHSTAWRLASAAIAAWLVTVIAAVCCAGELAASGTLPFNTVVAAMAGWHALIGVGEAVITVMVLGSVLAARPELLHAGEREKPARFYWTSAAYGLLVALALALFVSPLASRSPDGLERVIRDHTGPHSFAVEVEVSPARAAIAGGVGTLVVGGACVLVARTLLRRRSGGDSQGPRT